MGCSGVPYYHSCSEGIGLAKYLGRLPDERVELGYISPELSDSLLLPSVFMLNGDKEPADILSGHLDGWEPMVKPTPKRSVYVSERW